MKSATTRGRTLDHAAAVYDWVEPIILLGKQAEYDRDLIGLLQPSGGARILDIGCGTGVLTRAVADLLSAGGVCIGVDAAAKMIAVARRKRESPTCRFEIAAAEELPFEDSSFDGAVSSLFFHHVPLDLKERALREVFRVLRPGGRLVVADMHVPTTLMGSLVSHVARWFFMQPEIGENIRGVLPGLIETAGFEPPRLVRMYFGYIATFATAKPGAGPA